MKPNGVFTFELEDNSDFVIDGKGVETDYFKSLRDLRSLPLPCLSSIRLWLSSLASFCSLQFRNRVRKNSLLVAYSPVATARSTVSAMGSGREILMIARMSVIYCITAVLSSYRLQGWSLPAGRQARRVWFPLKRGAGWLLGSYSNSPVFCQKLLRSPTSSI